MKKISGIFFTFLLQVLSLVLLQNGSKYIVRCSPSSYTVHHFFEDMIYGVMNERISHEKHFFYCNLPCNTQLNSATFSPTLLKYGKYHCQTSSSLDWNEIHFEKRRSMRLFAVSERLRFSTLISPKIHHPMPHAIRWHKDGCGEWVDSSDDEGRSSNTTYREEKDVVDVRMKNKKEMKAQEISLRSFHAYKIFTKI